MKLSAAVTPTLIVAATWTQASASASALQTPAIVEIDRRDPTPPSTGPHLSDFTKTLLEQIGLGMDAVYSTGLNYSYLSNAHSLAVEHSEWIDYRFPYTTDYYSYYVLFSNWDYTLNGTDSYAEGLTARLDRHPGEPLSSDTPTRVENELEILSRYMTNFPDHMIDQSDSYTSFAYWQSTLVVFTEPYMHAFALKMAALHQIRIYQTMLQAATNGTTDAIAATNASIRATAQDAQQWHTKASSKLYQVILDNETRLRRTSYTTARICGSRVTTWHTDIMSLDPPSDPAEWDMDVFTAHCTYKRCKTDGCHDQLNTPEELATWEAEDIAEARRDVLVDQQLLWGAQWAAATNGILAQLERIENSVS